jgi:hypothetical protein
MKRVLCLSLLLALSACSVYPPGEDENGKQMIAAATPVLVAINKYMDDTARPPKNLQVLVPKYLDKVPDAPKIDMDVPHNVLTFKYIQSSSHNSEIICMAFIGQTDWSCNIEH